MPANTLKHIVMTSQTTLRRILCLLMLIVSLLMNVGSLPADTAQYYYDELGRLVGVVNGQGDAAVYQYDEVGNLLRIDRFNTTGGNVGIFFVTPGSSLVNKPVEIRGFGYTTPASSNTVSFNGTNATVVSGTTSSLLVTVPTGATTGPVTVTNANGTAASPQAFRVLVPPIIVGVSPTAVPQSVISRVTIQGFHLSSATAVTFTQAGLTATFVPSEATDSSLPVTLTVAGTVPVGQYAFAVLSTLGTAQSGTVTIGVRPGVSFAGVGGIISVIRPFPPTVEPQGPTGVVAPGLSVSRP